MSTKLNQIIAIEKGVKNTANAQLTQAYHEFQKTGPLNGISRTYEPRAEDGDRLPPESTRVQIKANDILATAAAALARMFDVTLTKDHANTQAKADVVVNDTTILAGVPVTYLLFLEKQLTDWQTVVRKLPTLDPAETWHYDANADAMATEPTKVTRGKKVPRNHVLAVATDKHPAQVEVYHEDVIVGDWTTIKFSGAVSQARVAELVNRAEALREAVKRAREEANTQAVTDQSAGGPVFAYLLGTSAS